MKLMMLNPLFYVIEGFRAAFFGTEWYFVTHWQYSLYFWGLVILLLLVGSALHVIFGSHFIGYLYGNVVKMDKAIIVKGVTKKYTLFNNTKERLYSLFFPKKYGEDFYALTNVNFEANHGEVIGFVGINGSGKSTLSNIIAGIVPETSGEIKVNGQ